MKIVFIAIKGIGHIGGIEKYTAEVGQRLTYQKHQVVVYCMKNESFQKRGIYNGMEVIPLPTIKHKYFEKMILVFFASLHQIFLPKVDIIHYHAIGPSIFSFIPRLQGRCTIFQSHGHEWKRSEWNLIAKIFFKTSERLSFLFANNSTAVSKNLCKYYSEKYNKNVMFIPSGINKKDIIPIQRINKYNVYKNKYFLFVGRFSREKRIEDLIKAYNQLIQEDIKLVIVGAERNTERQYTDEIKTLANQNKNIIFTGAVYGSELDEWYSNALAYILPSSSEGMPTTLLEAMSLSCPCIVSNIPASLEALDNQPNTYRYAVGDYHKLATLLQSMIDQSKTEVIAAINLRNHAYKNYSWDSITEKFIEFYQNSLHKRNINPPTT